MFSRFNRKEVSTAAAIPARSWLRFAWLPLGCVTVVGVLLVLIAGPMRRVMAGSQFPSTTALTLSSGTITAGQTVTLTATVTGQVGVPNPTGTVTFFNGTATLGTGTLNAQGVTTYTSTTSTFSQGTYSLTATYNGDTEYTGSTSPAQTLTVDPSGLTLSTTSLDFGNEPVGQTSAAQTVKVTNPGTTTINISAIAPYAGANPGAFAVTSNCPSALAAGASCTVSVTFTPTGIGAESATDAVEDDSTPGVQSFDVSGTGTGAVLQANPGSLKVIAGSGTDGYSGDGGLATVAELGFPFGITYDPSGNLYIADAESNVVRKVDTTGKISTFAGNGTGGYTGDGGAATAAELNEPLGVQSDSAGNIFITDQSNNVIRKVNASTGKISTFAGNGTAGYSGDGGAATSAEINEPQLSRFDSNGNLYITQCDGSVVRKVDTEGDITTVAGNGSTGYSGDGGPATSAQLYCPSGVTFDTAGNLYFTEVGNHVVRKVDTSGNISTIAGTGGTSGFAGDGGAATGALLSFPRDVLLDSAGDLYVADGGNNRVRKITTSTGIITTVAGGLNSAGSAALNTPETLTLDSSGNLYFTDGSSQVAEFFPQSTSPFPPTPVGTAATAQTVTLSNIGNSSLTIPASGAFTTSGNTTDFSLSGGTCLQGATLSAGANGTTCTVQISFTPTAAGQRSLRVSVADTALNSPQSFTIGGTGTSTTGSTASSTALTLSSSTITISQTVTLTATVTGSGVTPTGTVTFYNGSTLLGTGTLNAQGVTTYTSNPDTFPSAGTYMLTAVYGGDTTYATSTSPAQTLTVNPGGLQLTPQTLSFGNEPVGQTSAAQTVKVSNLGSTTITINQIASEEGSNPGAFSVTSNCPNALAAGASCTLSITFSPSGVGAESAGVDIQDNSVPARQAVAVSGTGTGGILQVNPGSLKIIAGDGTIGDTGDGGQATAAELNAPNGIAFDGSGNLYIADISANVVRKVDTTGKISTFAGTGTAGYSGDGGPATSADLYQPFSVQADAAGNIYIEDTGNNVIRKVSAAGTISTFAGNGTAGFAGDGGPAIDAEFNQPQGARFDSKGNLYVPQCLKSAVRKIDTDGNITTVAGNGTIGYSGDGEAATSAQLACPSGVAIDSTGDLYIADDGNQVIRKVDTNGIITTIAGNANANPGSSGDGGPATSALLDFPNDVLLDGAGNLDIADSGDNRVRQINLSTGIITTLVGGLSSAGSAAVNTPLALTLDAKGNVYFSNSGSGEIDEVFPQSTAPFPSTAVGTTAATQTVTLSNIGNVAITIPASGAFTKSGNASDFALTGGTCVSGATLTGGSTCTLQISFTPTAVGQRTLTVSVGDNALNSPQTFSIGGIATQGTPVVNWQAPDGPISYGTALSSQQLDATAADSNGNTIAGTFAYSPASGTVLGAGIHTLNVTFTPTDAVDYKTATGSISITVMQATPNLSWATPASITTTTALSSTQLDATAAGISGAALAGTFVYSPAAGATLAAGTQTLNVTFTPTDATDYTTATDSTTIVVTGAKPSFSSNVGTALAAKAVGLTFANAGTLETIQVLTQGVAGLDFTAGSGGSCATDTTYEVGQSCTVNVIFDPQHAGNRQGAVLLLDGNKNTLGVAYLQGSGVGPQVIFGTGSQSVVGGGLGGPQGLALDGSGNIYVADQANGAVKEIPFGCLTANCVSTLGSGFQYPLGLTVDGAGNVFFDDFSNSNDSGSSSSDNLVEEIPFGCTSSDCFRTLGSGFGLLAGVGVDGSGNVFVSDFGNNAVKEILAVNGVVPASPTINVLAGGFSGQTGPDGLTLDANGNVFVTNHDNGHALYEIPLAGGYTSLDTVSAGFTAPEDVAFDGTGNAFVVDETTNTLYELPAVGGSLPATSTVNALANNFSSPEAVAVDALGNVYVSDYGNKQVVKIDYSDAPSLSFVTTTTVGSTDTADGPQKVTIQNNGNAPLNFGSIAVNTNFKIDSGSTTCSTDATLAAGAACVVGVNFVPTTAGTLSGTLLLTDNALNATGATQSIPLSGKGVAGTGSPVAPVITWVPTVATISYGTSLGAAQLDATAATSGGVTIAGTFVYTPAAGAVLAVGTQTLSVTFTPTDATDYTTATKTVQITVTSASAATTTTTLTVTAGGETATTVASGTVVTLTASSTAGGNSVAPGQVAFCDATATNCTGIHLLATAQLVAGDSTSTATYKFVPGIGAHSYKVVFLGTGKYVTSSSTAAALTVTGTYPTTTAIAQSGASGNFTLTATTVGVSPLLAGPTGTITFEDTSNANASLGTAALGDATAALGFNNSASPSTGASGGIPLLGDFNGDGKLDLAVANSFSSGLTLFAGNGDGTFGDGTSTVTTGSPHVLAVGDFNGDGFADIAVSLENFDSTAAVITVLLGNGSGTFTTSTSSITNLNAAAMLAGDFNGDGVLDLAVVDSTSQKLTVLLGKGDGTFLASGSSIAAPSSNASLAVGDFNDDGKMDIVATSYFNGATILLGQGDGTFVAGATLTAGLSGPIAVVTGDFNGDGKMDVAIANNIGNNVSIFLGKGDGTFTTGSTPAATQAASLATGDFNGDGVVDLAAGNGAGGSVTVLLGNGDGTFAQGGLPTAGDSSSVVAAGDLNGDGISDVVASGGTASTVLLSTPTQTATASVAGVSPSAGTHAVAASYPGDTNYGKSTSATTSLIGTATTTVITWVPTVATIPYGTALSAAQLDATATTSGGVTIPGTFTYTPALGTVPTAGTQALSVTFAPTSTSFSAATGSATITVTQAAPVITWTAPAAIPYGTALSATQLDATVAGVDGKALAGTLVYAPALGTVLMPGTQTLSVTFTPTDAVNYTKATGTVQVVVGGLSLSGIAPVGAVLGSGKTTITLTGTGFVPSSLVLAGTNSLATTYVSPTMLTAVLPATLLGETGPLAIVVNDPSLEANSAAQTFTVVPATTGATLTGPATTQPGTQPSVGLTITNPYPLALTAEFNLAFASIGTTPVDDPSIQFSSGGRTFSYVVAANSTSVPPVQLQAGTDAGTITITAKLMAADVDVTPTGLVPLVIVVPAVVPMISGTTVTRSGDTLTVVVHGFSNTREVSSAVFDFTAATGDTLATPMVTIPATGIFSTWFSDVTSDAYGSTFTYTQIFNTSGAASTVGPVKVTLTNSVGVSEVSTGP